MFGTFTGNTANMHTNIDGSFHQNSRGFEGCDYFINEEPAKADFLSELKKGFLETPKVISPKFFYDELGMQLFGKITETPEYYVTRVELELLENLGNELSELVGKNKVVIEYGCGSSRKIATLLRTLNSPSEYLAIDISPDALKETTETIASAFPNVRVGGLCADFYSSSFVLPKEVGGSKDSRLVFFPGSTIGNQEPREAQKFLENIHNVLGVGGNLLIGVDLRKSKDLLEAAYNDQMGYTADFNLNLISRMKNELEIDISRDAFNHLAFYNEEKSRIEMHLVASVDQEFEIDGTKFTILKDEAIHTENSYKYTSEDFETIAVKSGFNVEKCWSDPDDLFSIQYLKAV